MKLDKYGLTKDAILNGDYPEFDEVAKPRREKSPMYLKSVVDGVIKDTFDDMSTLYEQIEKLTQERDELQSQVNTANTQLENVTKKVSVKDDDDAKLKRAEELLAKLDTQFITLKKQRSEDAAQITRLQQQIENSNDDAEIQKLTEEITEYKKRDAQREADYQSLADDVNAVLDGLSENFDDKLTVQA